MTTRSHVRHILLQSISATALVLAMQSAHAQFGGLFQSVLSSAIQQGAQQAANNAAAGAVASQAAPGTPAAATPVTNLTAEQINAIGNAANAIATTDPEYQAMLVQGLANVPPAQRNAMAPIVDLQVRQMIAGRRMGYTLPAGGLHQLVNGSNPVAQAALQNALASGHVNAAALGTDAGKAVAAGAILQGIGSLFNRPATPPAGAQAPAATTAPAPAP